MARTRAGGGLREVFDVAGANGIHYALNGPLADAQEFSAALGSGRNALWDAASLLLPDLRRRRDELAERIGTVNADWEAAEEAYADANSAYWRARGRDPESEATESALAARDEAARDRSAVEDAGTQLRSDIDRFRQDVESTEDQIASSLANVTGGTEVYGPGGVPVRTSQTFWGFVETPYPGAPSSLTQSFTLSQYLEHELSDAVATRITWLGSADEDDVSDWLADHPDFAQAVGFVDPAHAARLWEGLVADSAGPEDGDGAGPAGGWEDGPLAQLFALAPLAIGNLNGIPAAQRNLFNREGLAQLLERSDLDSTALEQLASLQEQLDQDSSTSLLSVFIDADGEPRASIAWGNVDTADQVTTLTHGIRTDMSSLAEWAGTGRQLRTSLEEEFMVDGVDAEPAVVLFLEWDSGGATQVHDIARPDAGAARLEQLVAGFAQTNPNAQQNLVVHSLGTTMAGQTIADNPGLFDGAWFFGSAGTTGAAADAIEQQIRAGDLTLHATHAEEDWLAPLGRLDISEHPIDPRTIPGVIEFGADGGYVGDVGQNGQRGARVGGHNTRFTNDDILWADWETTPTGDPYIASWESVGYLDPNAESYLHLVAGLSEAVQADAG